jgi:hypothetical protein
MPNKSLDASGGGVFRNLIGPARLNEIAPPRQLCRYAANHLIPMKRNSIGLLALVLFAAIVGCSKAPRVGTNPIAANSPVASPEIPFVPFCDLVANPSVYDQKIVRTKAIYSVGKDVAALWDTACDDMRSYATAECFHPPEKTCQKISGAIDKYRGDKNGWLGGNTLIDVIGQFHANGDQDQRRHRLELLEVKDAKAMDSVRHRS